MLRIEDFEPLLGQDFTIDIGAERFVLKLTEVTPLRHNIADPNFRPPFAITFLCPDQRMLNQQIWAMHNEFCGLHEIFLVPVARNAEGITYEAVFN